MHGALLRDNGVRFFVTEEEEEEELGILVVGYVISAQLPQKLLQIKKINTNALVLELSNFDRWK